MEETIVGIIWYTLVSVLIVITIAALAYKVVLVIDNLAREGKFFSYFRQGSIIAIMEGDIIVKLLFYDPKHVLSEEGEIIPLRAGQVRKKPWITWVGLYPYRQALHFKLKGMESADGRTDSSSFEIESMYLFWRHAYTIEAVGLESKNNIQLNISFRVVFERKKPERALFGVGSPQGTYDYACGKVKGFTKDVVRNLDISGILGSGSSDDIDSQFIENEVKVKFNDPENEILDTTGCVIHDIQIISIEEANLSERGRASLVALEIERREGDAAIERATKMKRAKELEGEGERDRLNAIRQALEDDRVFQVHMLEQVSKTNLVTLPGNKGGNNNMFLNIDTPQKKRKEGDEK